jgi:hypothetical protein
VTTCPVCAGRTRDGLMCPACWAQLARDLRAIPDLIADLELAASKQARLTPPGPGDLASERNPIAWDAARAADYLATALTTWALDVLGAPPNNPPPTPHETPPKRQTYQDKTRAHPAAAELWADITGHVHRARATIDRQDRHIDIGDCPDCGGTLRAHLPAADDRPAGVTCRTNPAHTWTPDQWLRLGRRILATKGPVT